MTDEELIHALRTNALWVTTHDAADRIQSLIDKIERMWDALEYVDAHIDLEEEISEEFAETVRILLWENDE
jgi:hypothetical protein